MGFDGKIRIQTFPPRRKCLTMALLADSDVIADMNTLATSDIVSDLNTLATSDIVSDLNTLATSDIVSDINILATSEENLPKVLPLASTTYQFF